MTLTDLHLHSQSVSDYQPLVFQMDFLNLKYNYFLDANAVPYFQGAPETESGEENLNFFFRENAKHPI